MIFFISLVLLSPFSPGHHDTVFLTLSYSSKINAAFYPQRVSLPLKKKCRDMYCVYSEGCDDHLVGYNSPLQIKVAIWHTFSEFEHVESGVDYNGSLARLNFFKKCVKRSLLSAVGCHTRPNHSADSLQRSGGP
jgi:hypothetical protein